MMRSPAKEIRPSTVLVIDDTDASRYTAARYFRNAGFAVWEASTGADGLRLVQDMPDLVVLDVQLPDVLGYEVCQSIRNNPATAHIPVMHVSATFTLSSHKAKGLDLGADAYLGAPIEPEELIATAKALLRMRRAEQDAQESNERLRFILSTMADAYLALDREWRFLEVNPIASTTLFNCPAEELLGQRITDVYPVLREGEYLKAFQCAAAEQRPAHFEALWPLAPKWLEVHAYPRSDQLEIYLRDISERKSVEAALSEAKTQLEAHSENLEKTVADRTARLQEIVAELEAFSYSMSHDMRAPLRAMTGFATLLLQEYGAQVDESGRNYMEKICASAQRLDSLIQDVLRYSKVARDQFPIERLELEDVVRDVIEQYPDLQPHHAEIVVVGPLPEVIGHRALLTQCISNLLGNAVKFVAPGVRPRVCIRAEMRESLVRLWFEDNGIGIPAADQERIFNMLERVHHKEAYDGTGIGLSIVRKAAERMGGSVGVESDLGQGSRFWLELPL